MRRARTRLLVLGLCLLGALIASSGLGASSSPQRGGTLRVGIGGSSATETNNPFLDSTNGAVLLRRILVYDAVTKLTPAGRVIGAAAGSWRYNKALTELRFTVRKGERFSDGTPMTPADIAYSLRLYGKIGFGFAGIPIGWPKVTVHGADVVAPLLQRRSDVAENLAQYSAVVKAGTKDFSTAPVGSGPFKIDVLTPGSGVARLVPNPFYPRPVYLDAIEIRSFTDPATETTAFLAGDLDVAIDVGGVNARRAQGVKGVKIDRKPGAVAYPFVMRLDDPPFNNPAVRLALKLAADRPALVNGVLDGWGTVGNDIFMPSDPDYDNRVPQRRRNLKQAAKLLEDAGYTASHPLKLTLWSTTFAPEMANAATLFVEQLDSGLPMVDAKVQMASADTYWTDVWLKKPFYTSYLQTFPLTRVMYDTLGYSRGAYNETGMHRADFDALVEKAVTTTDADARKRALFAAQKILHDQGGYIVWGYADEIDLARSNVHGLPTAAGKARYALWQTWLSKQ